MTRARDIADLAGAADAGTVTGANLIINGDMAVAQRGTSFSSISSAAYPVDRFFVQDVNGSVGEATVSQSTTTPDDFKYSLKVDVTTADAALVAADQYKIEYRIEGQNISHLNWGTSAAKTVTLSFWIRSNKTGNTQVGFMNSANDRAYVATFTIDAADTWEKKELTVEGDTSGTWLTTNGIGLRLRWGSFGSTYQTSSVDQWVGANVISRDDSPINFFDSDSNELYLTGVKLEVGDTATPFQHESYGENLAKCQRYFCNSNTTDSTTAPIGVGIGHAENTTRMDTVWQFPVQMRAAPTMTHKSDFLIRTGSNQTISTATFGQANIINVIVYATGFFTDKEAGRWYQNSSTIALTADAEL